MKITLDTDTLANEPDPQKLTGLVGVLQGFLDFIRGLQTKVEPTTEILPIGNKRETAALQDSVAPEPAELPPDDPYGQMIIAKLKRAQAQASRPARRASGWMQLGYGSKDGSSDRHI